MSDMKYGEASLRAREYFASKVKRQLNKNVTDYGLRFIKLTTLIPNWETYLTPKQREVALRYIKCMNAYEVDYQLNLNSGTTHQRLFGNKTSKGAIGRLEEVYKMLESNGYFEEKEKQKEAVNQTKKNKVRLTEKSLQNIKELFKDCPELVTKVDNNFYEKNLTKEEKKKLKAESKNMYKATQKEYNKLPKDQKRGDLLLFHQYNMKPFDDLLLEYENCN